MPSSKDTLKTPWRQPLNSSNWRENSPNPSLHPNTNPGNRTCQVVPLVPLIDSVFCPDEECNSIQNHSEWQGHKMKFWVCRQNPQPRPFNWPKCFKSTFAWFWLRKENFDLTFWFEFWFGKLCGKNDRFFLNATFHRPEQRSLCQI